MSRHWIPDADREMIRLVADGEDLCIGYVLSALSTLSAMLFFLLSLATHVGVDVCSGVSRRALAQAAGCSRLLSSLKDGFRPPIADRRR